MALKEMDRRFWSRLNELSKNSLKRQLYETFIAPTRLISVEGNQAKILVNSQFHKDWWRRQVDLVNTAALETYGDTLEYTTYFSDELSEEDYDSLNQEKVEENIEEDLQNFSSHAPYTFSSNLIKKYTFDNFVQGPQNQMTLMACMAITDNPVDLYNPLFIFSQPGLGKTHLLHAIGNEFSKKFPRKHVLYAPSETFVTDFVNATRKKQLDQFKVKYRNVDLLLLDDVQFFADKEGTINEFFNTFRELVEDKNHHVVITSDRPPAELKDLPDRLITRFSWGLTTNITAPDFETRMAILMNKAEKTGLHFPDETISYIAGQINSNVRELEGALNQVEFTARMSQATTVDIPTAEHALEALKVSNVRTRRTNLSIHKIKDETAKYYHLPLSDLIGPKRQKEIANARQVAMYLIRELLGTSLPAIGQEFNGRDHTTVMYAVKQIDLKMKNDSETQRDLDNLKRKLEN